AHAPLAQMLLGLGVFEKEAHAAHRIAEHERLVERREAIGGGALLRCVVRRIAHARPTNSRATPVASAGATTMTSSRSPCVAMFLPASTRCVAARSLTAMRSAKM